jgi:hypothetical protein
MEQLLRRGAFTALGWEKSDNGTHSKDQYFYLESRSLSVIGSKSRQSILCPPCFNHVQLWQDDQ